ncbi:hypothetical protein [Acinetobacter baumannii]|uniref:hypothetical protein n=1 Tax=Acinetobacter baumannii TaxID=470 RepID=UPI00366ADCED
MLYSLVLVVFLSNGSEDRTTLAKNYQDYSCIDSRDVVRSQLDYYNNLESKGDVEFVDVECVAQKDFI